MGLRRPNLIKWDSDMEKTLFGLESKEKALPSDKSLSLWLRLQLIADDAGQRMAKSETPLVDISDSNVSKWMREVEDEMSKWKMLQANQANSRKFIKLRLKSSRAKNAAAEIEII